MLEAGSLLMAMMACMCVPFTVGFRLLWSFSTLTREHKFVAVALTANAEEIECGKLKVWQGLSVTPDLSCYLELYPQKLTKFCVTLFRYILYFSRSLLRSQTHVHTHIQTVPNICWSFGALLLATKKKFAEMFCQRNNWNFHPPGVATTLQPQKQNFDYCLPRLVKQKMCAVVASSTIGV